jgi:thiamine pyrophosphate-dependent acetolactate synthase large subunit-like protein
MDKNRTINIILQNINGPVISANGHISRNLYEIKDLDSNFYMIGSMGLASSIGLGIALKNSKKTVFVLDGDGNILMNLGSLTTVGSLKPTNFVHFILDNQIHESTGGQPTHSKRVSLEKIAKAAGYAVYKTDNKLDLEMILKKIKTVKGPIMILIKISQKSKVGKRIEIKPEQIKKRFSESLKNRY